MEVSFIIPLYNALGHTREALRTLQATLPPGLPHEILLVDDGSTDGTRGWLATLRAPCRALLNERNLGFAGACNRGAGAAHGAQLFFLNNDLVFRPGWLEPMLRLLDRPDTGVVGNVQRNAATGAVDHAGVYFDAKGKPAHRRRRPPLGWLAGHQEVPAVTGACCALRADTWRELGGFDEGFRNGGEDIDLCLRARAAGRRNRIALRSVVGHHVSASPGRKLRDEQNSRRLATRWRAALTELATRECARACLAAAWADPRDYADRALVHEAAAHWLRLRPAGPRLRAAVQAALALEFARWDHLLEGAPAPDERTVAHAYFPAIPEPAPVL